MIWCVWFGVFILKSRIQQDVTAALKEKNELKRTVLSSLLSSVKNMEIEKRGRSDAGVENEAEAQKQSELSDDEVIRVIGTELKKRKEAAEQYEKGGRQELADKERQEAEILSAYLPEQLGEEALRDVVRATVDELGLEKDMKNMGAVIKAVMEKIKGQSDGSTVSKIVRDEITNPK